MGSVMDIRNFTHEDYPQIAAIYMQGIETGIATFETSVPAWDQWDKAHLAACRIVAYEGQTIKGWAALTPVSGRCVYAGVAEVSVYVAAEFRGSGIGRILLQRLIHASEEEGLWTLQAGIFSENKASIQLHEKCGFRMIGYREKIGQLNGVWKDTVLMERRSTNIGV